MKKKVGIILVILVIVALAIVLGCILKFSKEEIEIENKGRILVEDAYCNYAWGYYYTGSAIFEDGSIYSWNFGNEDYEKESDNTIETQIKKKGKLESKRVSDDDLKKII